LIITNHHVAFSAIQRQSTPEHNYLQDGFDARTKDEELPAIGYNVYVVKSFKDVTSEVLRGVREGMTGLKRYQAVEKASKRIIREAEKGRDVKCKVVSMYGGSQYHLFTYFKIRDVRVVYAPPRAIGDYGGEIDNWMWPRHAGDFAFLRAYVAPDGKSADYSALNVPYDSPVYLKLSSAGIKEGDFVMLIGFPGKTKRYESSYGIDKMVNHDYPLDIQTRREVISILEIACAEDSSKAIRLSSQIKGLNNYLKKNQGMLEGFQRARILQKRIEEERSLETFLRDNPKLSRKYGSVLAELDSLFEAYREAEERRFVLDWMTYRSKFLDFASSTYKWSLERRKKDEDREPGYQDRDTLEAREGLEDAQVNLVPSADKLVLIYFLRKALQLPSDQKIAAIKRILHGQSAGDVEQTLERFADGLYQGTGLGSLEKRLKMFGMGQDELEEENDPFIRFAKELEAERERLRQMKKDFSGTLSRLEPKLIGAYSERKGKALYPDANGTIRFNYGEVKGYYPKDAVSYRCITGLKGVMEKDSGKEPFEAPEELKEVYRTKDLGRYLDATIGDVPVNFLSTNDITNGNSGSPVMNGRGELVGLAFDGNYESISSDYVFEPELTRAINVDIRYVLFLLDKVYRVESLLDELSVR
jgi:hypothetical protein